MSGALDDGRRGVLASRLAWTGPVAGGAVAAAGLLRWALNPRPRYAPSERPPFGEFAGYTAAETLCDLTEDRDDVGVLVLSRENYFTFWPMVPGIVGSEVDIDNVARPLRRSLIESGASFRRAELESVDFGRKVVLANGGKEYPYDHLILALGSQPNFFGVPGVKEHSFVLGVLVELGGRFAVNDVMGVRFSGLAAALFWRAIYRSKLESPRNRARVAADWILGLLFRPAATEIRELA